jgi:transcription elongation factor GreA
MTTDRSAASLLRAVGLLADGPLPWGRPVPAGRPGVFVVELATPLPSAPIELTRIGKWLERVPGLRLDGEVPTSRQLAARIASFWLPEQPVLYVGAASSSIGGRIAAIAATPLGDRRPNPSAHWLHTLRDLSHARVWWAVTPAVEEYEDALLTEFAAGVSESERAGLPDRDVVLPFANLRNATASRKATGLAGSLIPEPPAAPRPGTTVVDLPDAAADGADGSPEPRRGRGPTRASAAPPTSRARTTAATRPASTRAASAVPPIAASPSPAAPAASNGRATPAVELTADGAARLQAELDGLVKGRRPEVIARIRAAKELGDLKENADYTAAREEQSFLEGRIQAIEARLREAVIVAAPTDRLTAQMGSRVTIEGADGEATYELVGSADADPTAGRLSVVSPVGRALLGRAVGDAVTVRTPRGDAVFQVVRLD